MHDLFHVVCLYGNGQALLCYSILDRFVGPGEGPDDTTWTRDFAGVVAWRPWVRAIYMDQWNGSADCAARIDRVRRERPAPNEPFLVLINRDEDESLDDLPPEALVIRYEGDDTRLPEWLQ